jgi:hypothetical protein
MKTVANRMSHFLVMVGLLGMSSVSLAAQEYDNTRWTANVGGGFTVPEYNTGTRHDNGWNFNAGAGANFLSSHVGLMGEFMYNSLGVNSATLQTLQFPNGSTSIWAVSAEPVVRFNPHGQVDFYLVGGPGVYHRNVEFTQPTIAAFSAFDPFFGIFQVAVPANQVLLSYSTTKLGVNGGGGVSVHLGHSRAKIYAEARYHQMYTRTPTAFVPVTFGIRW